MTSVPLRSIYISDFRRLGGHRTLPLDAPIVLLHGDNGVGKTSVLSALELALTGQIRSMRRHDPRYTAHLPFHGQDFATVRADVSGDLATTSPDSPPLTVGGSRIDGRPALNPEAARFFAERCYLDQVSLGQLLELYQYREGKEESALARFVNELLGLEQLDALREGLYDAADIRRLKKLSEPLATAETEARKADADLAQATTQLNHAQGEMATLREGLAAALASLGIAMSEVEDEVFAQQVGDLLRAGRRSDERSTAIGIDRSLTALGGRISILSTRPSVLRLNDVTEALASASARFEAWRRTHQPTIDAWRRAAIELRAPAEAAALIDEIRKIGQTLVDQEDRQARRAELEEQLAQDRAALLDVQEQFSATLEQAGSLAEALASLREHSVSNVCPLCDRDFGEVSSTHLTSHLDRKVAELTSQGAQLAMLREQRAAAASLVQRDQQSLEQLRTALLPAAQIEALVARRNALNDLHSQLVSLLPVIAEGAQLQSEVRRAEAQREDLDALTRDTLLARSELEHQAQALGVPRPPPDEPLQDAWRRLADLAARRVAHLDAIEQAHAAARDQLEQFARLQAHVKELKDSLTVAADRKLTWESRLREARRRQAVAKTVYDASAQARASIVQRVFTGSLNEVWRSVFTRLAPREPFIPAFGIPNATRANLELTLQTIHSSGETGGSPQMMLSAGNLNTAALSLFIALHLAVEPLVPCLVFDDPVQSMDEVHIAQFAALIRVLSKHHQRQVIIAVHERELFQYLALELSPAFQSDELITIELGARALDEDGGVTRLTWSPDRAVAI